MYVYREHVPGYCNIPIHDLISGVVISVDMQGALRIVDV